MFEFYPDDYENEDDEIWEYDEDDCEEYELLQNGEEDDEWVDQEPDYSDLAAEEAYYRSWRGRLFSLKIRIRQFFINLWHKFFPYKIKDDIPF